MCSAEFVINKNTYNEKYILENTESMAKAIPILK